MTAKRMHTDADNVSEMCHAKELLILPSRQIPHPHIPIASTADEDILPWDHSPYSHNMTLQDPLCIPFRVKNMNLRIVKGHNDVFRREVETGNDSTILRNIPRDVAPTCPPCGIDQVSLLEV